MRKNRSRTRAQLLERLAVLTSTLRDPSTPFSEIEDTETQIREVLQALGVARKPTDFAHLIGLVIGSLIGLVIVVALAGLLFGLVGWLFK